MSHDINTRDLNSLLHRLKSVGRICGMQYTS